MIKCCNGPQHSSNKGWARSVQSLTDVDVCCKWWQVEPDQHVALGTAYGIVPFSSPYIVVNCCYVGRSVVASGFRQPQGKV